MSYKVALVGDFAEYTTAHGLASIKRAQQVCGRLLWTVFLLVAWTAMTYQVYVAIYNYFQHETVVSVQMIHKSDVDFPAVTICNLNVIRWSQIKEIVPIQDFMNSLNNEQITQSEWSLMDMGHAAGLTDDAEKEALFYYALYTYDINITAHGHQMKHMMVECTFQGKQCFPGNFSGWVNAKYGNCYTLFVSSGAYPSFVGPIYGLSLTLYTQDDTEYITRLSSAAGFRSTKSIKCDSGCLQSCEQYSIESLITSSLWPLEGHYNKLKSNWEKRLNTSFDKGHSGVQQHMAKLEVYFEDLNFESIVESPAMGIWALLSSIGGTLGLYGGLSFLTLIEFVELGICLFFPWYSRAVDSRVKGGSTVNARV